MPSRLITCIFGALLLCPLTTFAAPVPELIVCEARVHTIDDARPQATAFAVAQGKFVAIGNDAEIRALAGPQTRVLKLAGKTVVPGFHDAHLHPRPIFPEDSRWAVVEAGPPKVKTMDELIAALKRKAALTPAGEWITGTGYQETKLGRHPTRHDLDLASTEHPIVVSHSSGHQRVANSKALVLAGITRETRDPAGGHIVHDEKGEPTGRLQESASRLLAAAGHTREARAPESETIAGYRACLANYLARGITSIGVAGGSPGLADSLAKALGDEPSLRVYQMFGDNFVDEAVRRKTAPTQSAGGIRYGGIKSFHGNSLSGQTCWLYEPYANRPDYYGVPPARSQAELNELVLRIHRAGLQACIHSNGDREIDMVLNAYEHAQKVAPRADARHRIEHCSIVNASIVARIKALGVIPVPHAYLWEHGDKHHAYGPARWEWMHATRSFLEAGIPVAGHSDAPVSQAYPLLRIQEMVTRTSEQGVVYGASQRVSAAEALRIWTLGGAYASFSERENGSITVGKFADFVVLAADPLHVEAATIKDIAVEMTVVGGRVVHPVANAVYSVAALPGDQGVVQAAPGDRR